MSLLFNRRKKDATGPGIIPPGQPVTVVQVVTPAEMDRLRPCYARGRKAIFHRWVNSAHPVLPRGEEPTEGSRYYQFRRTEALVEYEDGTMGRIFPSNLQFADGGDFDKFDWLPMNKTDQEGQAYE